MYIRNGKIAAANVAHNGDSTVIGYVSELRLHRSGQCQD